MNCSNANETLEWSERSPDLHFFESSSSELARQIYDNGKYFNLEELRAIIEGKWFKADFELRQNLVMPMEKLGA